MSQGRIGHPCSAGKRRPKQNAQPLAGLRVDQKCLVLGPISRILSAAVNRCVVFISLRPPCDDRPPCCRTCAWHNGMRLTRDCPTGRRVPYLVLHRIGFFLPPSLPSARWALTPPFHPYPSEISNRRSEIPNGRYILCDTVRHAALKRRAPSFAGNPALWCPDFPLRTVFSGPGVTRALGSKNFGAKTWPQN